VDDGSTLGYDSTDSFPFAVSATATQHRRGSPFVLERSTQREIKIYAVGDEFVLASGARHLGRGHRIFQLQNGRQIRLTAPRSQATANSHRLTAVEEKTMPQLCDV
jgi:hypothetical protein